MSWYRAAAIRLHNGATPSGCVAIALCHAGATSRAAASRKTAAADKEKVRRPTRQGVIENSFCESADKSLLGTEDDPRTSSVRRSRGRCLITEPHRRCYRARNHLGISAETGQQQTTLLCMRRGDATHGTDHRIELLHAVDTCADRGEVVSHCRSAAATNSATALRSDARLAVGHRPVPLDICHRDTGMLVQPARQCLSQIANDICRHRIEQPLAQRNGQRHLVGEPQRRELRLHQQRADALATGDLRLHARIRHAAEAGEHLQFEELRIVQPEHAGAFAQRRRLGLAADPAHAGADVDRRLLPCVNSCASSTIWPSVIEIRLVGI